MATYANDLRLKEIATGDEDGTWGISTNTNLSLIAGAFGYGTKELAADANETFTMPDATADGTRALYLKITSAVSLSATRTVTLAPNTVSKVWIIENATTGSQSIEIKQGSGATVTIPKGSAVIVYTNGTGSGAAVVSATAVINTNPVLSGPVINDGFTEEVYAVSGTTPALSPTNGSIQTWTLSGASTPTAGTWASGQSIELYIDDGSANTITWTSMSITWLNGGGAAPALETSGYTTVVLVKLSTTLYGFGIPRG